MSTSLFANRYHIISQVGEGGMGSVNRAHDRLTGETVALKQLAQISTTSNSFSSTSLAREFRVLASLHHPNIIKVLDYGFEGHSPFFTMQLIEDAQTITNHGRSRTLEVKVELLVQLLQAMTYIHRRGLIHRDIKPANVIVTAEGVVKVLDFGLVVLDHGQKAQIMGTLMYMAPEILKGHPVNQSIDLYAIGLIAYELFTGKYPFNMFDVKELAHQIVHEPPDLSILDAIPTAKSRPSVSLGQIVGRLLDKDPNGRYGTAEDIIHDLCEVANLHIPQETFEIRESFLRASKFVGRKDELNQLLNALNQLRVKPGRGGMWLVGGESGVGKSRLVDELAIQAMVQGVTVVRGQAIEGGGFPFQLWRSPVQRLLLLSDVDDHEASILKEITPNIKQLLGRVVLDIARLEGNANRQRLTTTLSSLLLRQTKPILLILEDIQWTKESLDPIKQIIGALSHHPILIVATYRTEEAPDLPIELIGANQINLQRLSNHAISVLSEAMLGPNGTKQAVVDYLTNETEGNVLFLIEILRTLAQETGYLSKVGSVTLPQKYAAGGIIQILKRRLRRVPDWGQKLLRIAAASGRNLDLDLLSHLTSKELIDKWLQVCSVIAIVELVDGVWRFSHDKLRDAALADLASDQIAQLHEQIGIGIEEFYKDDLETWINVLYYQWSRTTNNEKALYYLEALVNYLLGTTGDYEFVKKLSQHALQDLVTEDLQRVRILNYLSEAFWRKGEYKSAQKHAKQADKLSRKIKYQEGIAQSNTNLGWISELKGHYEQAEVYFLTSLERFLELKNRKGEAKSLGLLGTATAYLGDIPSAKSYYQRSLVIYQQTDEQTGIAETLFHLGRAFQIEGNYEQANKYLKQSLEIRQSINDNWGIAISLHSLGTIAYLHGYFDEASDYLQQSLEIRRTIHDQWGIAACLNSLGMLAYLNNDYELAQEYLNESLNISGEMKNQQGVAETLTHLATVNLELGNFTLATEQFETSHAVMLDIGHQEGIALALLGLSFVHLHQKNKNAPQTLYQALTIASSIGAYGIILGTIAGVARLQFEFHKNPEGSAELVGLIQAHSAHNTIVQRRYSSLLHALKQALPSIQLDKALEKGKNMILDDVVQRLLTLNT